MPKIAFRQGWSTGGGNQQYFADNPETFEGGRYRTEDAILNIIKTAKDGTPDGDPYGIELWKKLKDEYDGWSSTVTLSLEVILGAHENANPHFDVVYAGYCYHFCFCTQSNKLKRITS